VYILDPTWGSSNKKVQMKRYTPTLLKNKNKNDAGHEEQKKTLLRPKRYFLTGNISLWVMFLHIQGT
jgi:hypothetical protein